MRSVSLYSNEKKLKKFEHGLIIINKFRHIQEKRIGDLGKKSCFTARQYTARFTSINSNGRNAIQSTRSLKWRNNFDFPFIFFSPLYLLFSFCTFFPNHHVSLFYLRSFHYFSIKFLFLSFRWFTVQLCIFCNLFEKKNINQIGFFFSFCANQNQHRRR